MIYVRRAVFFVQPRDPGHGGQGHPGSFQGQRGMRYPGTVGTRCPTSVLEWLQATGGTVISTIDPRAAVARQMLNTVDGAGGGSSTWRRSVTCPTGVPFGGKERFSCDIRS